MARFLYQEENKIIGGIYKTYELKCIKESDDKHYGRDKLIVGNLYECTVIPASNWKDIYAVKIGNGGIEAFRDCFEPLP